MAGFASHITCLGKKSGRASIIAVRATIRSSHLLPWRRDLMHYLANALLLTAEVLAGKSLAAFSDRFECLALGYEYVPADKGRHPDHPVAKKLRPPQLDHATYVGSKIDQCYFDFHLETGELLLHDVSTHDNTQLRNRDMNKQIRKSPRQCVVLLDCEWNFQTGRGEFHLKPWEAQDPEAFVE